MFLIAVPPALPFTPELARIPVIAENSSTVPPKLVNALAKYQVEQFKVRQKERFEDNKRMHDAAIQRYSQADFEQINAGIDAAFAKDGVMNFIVRNSEIGNDPEFLELMRWYGQHHPTNTQPAGGGGGGGLLGGDVHGAAPGEDQERGGGEGEKKQSFHGETSRFLLFFAL